MHFKLHCLLLQVILKFLVHLPMSDPCAGKDMHHLLRGLKAVGTVFQELSIIAASVAIVQVASAAGQWHVVTVLVALLSVCVSGLRIATWHHPEVTIKSRRVLLRVKWLLSKQIRWSLSHSSKMSEDSLPANSISRYTFTRKQEQVMPSPEHPKILSDLLCAACSIGINLQAACCQWQCCVLLQQIAAESAAALCLETCC